MPDVIEVERSGEEEVLVIGCDGVWEKYGDDHEQLTKQLREELKQFNSSDCLKRFFDKNLNPGTTPTDPYGRDNMTAILLEFKK
jgi:serine/threonine protein phosphatase PrpC